jgi:hypothetical protein
LRLSWKEHGSLYSPATLEQLKEDIREAVGCELGGWADEPVPVLYVDPSRWDDPPSNRPDEESNPFTSKRDTILIEDPQSVRERRADALEIALKRARQTPAPPPAPTNVKADWFKWLTETEQSI